MNSVQYQEATEGVQGHNQATDADGKLLQCQVKPRHREECIQEEDITEEGGKEEGGEEDG